ncbi:MAG: Gfo/Idh/MocA family oxidoreductase [Verrucomicrobia bacterium]|nr:Gfo/Idh/MocA family oxidoreductase [Verrucomicrobiota bacterium]
MKTKHVRSERPLTRRDFLRRTATAAAATIAGPLIVPGRVLGLDGGVAPSNRITIGYIGTGRQTSHVNIPAFLHQEDSQSVAVCDVDSWRMNEAREAIDKFYSEKSPSGRYRSCRAIGDWRDLIAADDIDAVMIGTPDHWHVILALAALKSGKDVALEKPVSRDIAGGRLMADAVKRHQRVFCTDSEFRTYRWNRMMATMARNGKFGKLQRIIAVVPQDPTLGPQSDMPVPEELNYDMWLGPAAEKPYTESRVHPRHMTKGRPGWICIQEYNSGIMANWGAHWMDIAMWGMGTETTGPTEVEATGSFPPRGNLWDTVQEMDAHCYFDNGVELVCRTGTPSLRFEGTEGWAQVVFPSHITISDESLLTWEPGPNDVRLTPMKSEKRDFLDAIKERRQPQYDAEGGHRVNTMACLSMASIALGRRLKWDPVQEAVIGDDEANEWLKPQTPRAPWKV